MKKVTESTGVITLESIINHVSIGDIPNFRASLREMMDGYFLWCAELCVDPEPAWCAFRAVDSLLAEIHEYTQSPGEQTKAAGV